MKTALLLSLAALLVSGCSPKSKNNYARCLKLRVGMPQADLFAAMGAPEETFPYVEGKSLPHLAGRTAYEWSNPASMSGPNHVSVETATGKVESIRCANAMITAQVYVEPPAPAPDSPAMAPSVPAAPAAPPRVRRESGLAPGKVLD